MRKLEGRKARISENRDKIKVIQKDKPQEAKLGEKPKVEASKKKVNIKNEEKVQKKSSDNQETKDNNKNKED